ncbi:hypothetical protein [Flavobacterium sp.]|uniref:hypothetical protein n=1 Tax=Flavobacterium sp. TaxID=239 RepID=UPI00375346CA
MSLLTQLNLLSQQPSMPSATQVMQASVLLVKQGKIMDRIKAAKTKKEKAEIIEEWVLCEIKKINNDSEMCEF